MRCVRVHMRSGSGPSAPVCTISRASGPCTAIIAQSSILSLTRASGKSTWKSYDYVVCNGSRCITADFGGINQNCHASLSNDGVLTHGEMATDRGLIMMATPTPNYEGPLQHRSHCERAAAWSAAPWVIDGVLVYVDDIESHFERAQAAGAGLLSGIEAVPEDIRLYRAEDLEGHRWMFMQHTA